MQATRANNKRKPSDKSDDYDYSPRVSIDQKEI